MKLIIILSKKTDPSFQKRYEIVKFPISLGRDDSNEIVLEDNHKIISRKHARIIDHENKLQLIDLGSANFTLLNEQKIIQNEENELKAGDKIIIGDYELEVIIQDQQELKEFDDQKTLVFTNPFAEDIQRIARDLSILSEKYSFDETPMKSEMLRISLIQNLDSLEKNEVSQVLSEFFADKFLGRIESSNKNEQESHKTLKSEYQQFSPQNSGYKHNGSSKSALNFSFSTYFSQVVDTMLDSIIKMIEGFLQFRQEFYGVTKYYSVPTQSLQELKEFLFNQEISSNEQSKRLNLFKEETNRLLSHQIGLLEGYRMAVTEGCQSLLHSLDPDIIEKEIENRPNQGLADYLPYAKKLKTLESINTRYKKLISDLYHMEIKFFRPAFNKGYQKRILSKSDKNEY